MSTCSHFMTVGHSNHNIEKFGELIASQGVEAIADVRSHPKSAFAPWFNESSLRMYLSSRRIYYVPLGKELGGRSANSDCYDETGQIIYSKLAKTAVFHSGVQRLISGSRNFRIAIMCTEKDPLDCHRFLLISRYLTLYEGASITHLHSDGHLESQLEAESRLRAIWDLSQPDFFADDMQQLDRAINLQSKKAAYRLPKTEMDVS